MVKNEIGTEIPEHIVSKAMEMGCLKTKYIYKNGEYGGKFPASNLGGGKATRFGNWDRVEKHKIQLGDNWVIFESPTYSEQNIYSTSMKERSHVTIKHQEEPTVVQYIQGDHITKSVTEIKDSVVVKSNIDNSVKKGFKICPYCGENLDFPEPPKFCPFCAKQILK